MNMKAYVARDKDKSLWVHYRKPKKENNMKKTWWGSDDRAFEIFDFDFPNFKDVTWEGNPVEVELTIERTNKEEH